MIYLIFLHLNKKLISHSRFLYNNKFYLFCSYDEYSSTKMLSCSRKENDSLFLNTIKKLYTESEYLNISTEKLQILSDKIYQIWMRSINTRNIEGYYVIQYLEEFIKNNQMNDQFFILIINILSKNTNFYQLVLNDHQRFKQLFNLSIKKTVYLIRYIELLYYYCPIDLISTVGLEFYRFVSEYLRQRLNNNIDCLAAFSILIYQFYENIIKNFMPIESIFINQKDAIDYSIYVIDTFLYYNLNIKNNDDLIHDIKLINIIIKTIGIVWEQNSTQEK